MYLNELCLSIYKYKNMYLNSLQLVYLNLFKFEEIRCDRTNIIKVGLKSIIFTEYV